MQTFISETIQTIAKQNNSFDDVVIVLPSQRAKVFVKQELVKYVQTGFLPEIFNIEEFVSSVSEIKEAELIELIFHLYEIYKKTEINLDSFDKFSSWASTVIRDFSEIDKQLVTAQEIFIYIRDVQRLRKWSVKGTFKETDLMKDYYKFLENLNKYYKAFYSFLTDNKIGYKGILYREATKKITPFLLKNHNKKFYFIGLNALSKSEEKIIQQMLSEGKTQVFWDISKEFLESKHQAGSFIRKYAKNWKYYEKNDLKTVGEQFLEEKKIEVIGASKNVTQIKHVGEILSNLVTYENTALVLPDESLLPVVLNSLPQNIDKVNITMGYPLKNISTTNVIFAIFQLFLSQEKMQKTSENLFYYKDVVSFLQHPIIYELLNQKKIRLGDAIFTDIEKNNRLFVSQELLMSFIGENIDEQTKAIIKIFNPFTNVNDFIIRILSFINELKNTAGLLERESLFHYFKIITQLHNLQKKFGFIVSLKTLHQFLKQLISAETLSFQGEPLQGLQIMGMLETRVLDFENIIITSVNEGVLPANTQQSSFIPFDAKIEFRLPAYQQKDAVFSYHFFRLMQRAKNIYLLYNTENDSFGKGEKSRFITQLELMRPNIKSKIVSPEVISETNELKEVLKNGMVLNKLQEFAKKGVSPSALATYLYNPIVFYKQKVLKIRELDNVEEEVAFKTLGTVVHDTLEELYKPCIGAFLSVAKIEAMQKKVTQLAKKYFTKHFKNGDISTGKNRLAFEVAVRFVENFLRQEKKLVADKKNTLKILATEENLSAEIYIDGLNFPIKIHGQVDRVDELNGITRIIDYKTGMVKNTDLRVTDFTKIRDYKYSKAIQVLMYAMLYKRSKNIEKSKPIEAGVVSFKNLKSGFLPVNFSEKRGVIDSKISEQVLSDFIKELSILLQEIFDVNISFKQPLETAF